MRGLIGALILAVALLLEANAPTIAEPQAPPSPANEASSAGVGGAGVGGAGVGGARDGSSADRGLQEYALSLINKDRRKARAPAVQENARLSVLAQWYAEFLARTGFFGHVDPLGRSPQDRATIMGIQTPISENLAWQCDSSVEPPELLDRAEATMMAEPRNGRNHRFNILNPQSRFVGIGVARTADKVILVQEFTTDEP